MAQDLVNGHSMGLNSIVFAVGLGFRLIGLVGRVFANGPGDLDSIPSGVLPKTFKMVLDTSLVNTQQYELRIKGKVEAIQRKE